MYWAHRLLRMCHIIIHICHIIIHICHIIKCTGHTDFWECVTLSYTYVTSSYAYVTSSYTLTFENVFFLISHLDVQLHNMSHHHTFLIREYVTSSYISNQPPWSATSRHIIIHICHIIIHICHINSHLEVQLLARLCQRLQALQVCLYVSY